jgi:predicted XRE-type DNA-binding protein
LPAADLRGLAQFHRPVDEHLTRRNDVLAQSAAVRNTSKLQQLTELDVVADRLDLDRVARGHCAEHSVGSLVAIEDTPQQVASMRARSTLMMALENIIKQRGMTQADAAGLFGVTQPRVSDLMRGKINLFSMDCLIDMGTVAGLEPHVTIKKTKEQRKRRKEELAAA